MFSGFVVVFPRFAFKAGHRAFNSGRATYRLRCYQHSVLCQYRAQHWLTCLPETCFACTHTHVTILQLWAKHPNSTRDL